MSLRVAVLHQRVAAKAPADEQDVLCATAAVSAALSAAGHVVHPVACGLNLQALLDHPAVCDADVVFNLVETLAGNGRLIHLAPAVLESARIPYTGNSAEAQFTTSGKLLAKRLLAAGGIATPPWVDPADAAASASASGGRRDWIVKSVWEHASVGMDDNAVLRAATAADAAAAAAARGPGWFAEQFMEGREFNVALLETAGGELRVLPPAEIVYEGYPQGKPRIVGYDAKWRDGTFEASHTVRRLVDRADEAALRAQLEKLARACWALFGLAGYARVDIRADIAGNLYVLEVNANPCLSPDAGFAAALAAAGIAYNDAICGLAAAALRNNASAAARQAERARRAAPRFGGAITFRSDIRPDDAATIRRIVADIGFFSEAEVAIAQELADERLAKGESSGYYFVMAEYAGKVIGYTCYGPVPGTASSFDLYWIAVDPSAQRGGLGQALLAETEKAVVKMGGTRLYAETSGRAQYAPTRRFYERIGFTMAEVLDDFYDTGDARVTYCKLINCAHCAQ